MSFKKILMMLRSFPVLWQNSRENFKRNDDYRIETQFEHICNDTH